MIVTSPRANRRPSAKPTTAFVPGVLTVKQPLPAVFQALDKVKYKGWAVVELDRVPVKDRTPKESAMISRQYLQEKIGVKFAS